jgi:prevent-host-death family protein
MTTAPVVAFSEARTHLTEIVNKVAYGGKRIILARKGQNLVAIVPLDDLDALEALEDQIDIAAAKKAEGDVKKHGTVSWKKAKKCWAYLPLATK